MTLLNKNPNVGYADSREIPGTALYNEMALHRVVPRLGERDFVGSRVLRNVLGNSLRAAVKASLIAEVTPGGQQTHSHGPSVVVRRFPASSSTKTSR